MTKQHTFLRLAFYALMRVFLYVILGFNVRRKHLLPRTGPAVVIANHNSHLDTMVLMSLFALRCIADIHPVAAADHFLRNKWSAWFSQKIVGIIPIERGGASSGHDPLTPCYEALAQGKILIIFPEGTRGDPEKLTQFKKGIAHLATKCPQAPITPVFMHGLGKSMPKDDPLIVPFFCDIFVGEPLPPAGDIPSFMQTLTHRFGELVHEGNFEEWR